mmetsp:Transcript_96724/g.277774  ORF Transcript_96724/g.277774 Transcript_96724/m.277774 type:complete len:183 (-) Transcript_96724:201-749(-)
MDASAGSASSLARVEGSSVLRWHLGSVARMRPQPTTAPAKTTSYRASKSQLDEIFDLEHDSQRFSGNPWTTYCSSFDDGDGAGYSFSDIAAVRRELQMQLDEPEDTIGDGLVTMSGSPASALRARRKIEDALTEAQDYVRIAALPGSSIAAAPVSLVPTPPRQPRQGAPAPRPKKDSAVVRC